MSSQFTPKLNWCSATHTNPETLFYITCSGQQSQWFKMLPLLSFVSLPVLKFDPFFLLRWVSSLHCLNFWIWIREACWDEPQLNSPKSSLNISKSLKLLRAPVSSSYLQCPLNVMAKLSLISDSLLSHVPELLSGLSISFPLWSLLLQCLDCHQRTLLQDILRWFPWVLRAAVSPNISTHLRKTETSTESLVVVLRKHYCFEPKPLWSSDWTWSFNQLIKWHQKIIAQWSISIHQLVSQKVFFCFL